MHEIIRKSHSIFNGLLFIYVATFHGDFTFHILDFDRTIWLEIITSEIIRGILVLTGLAYLIYATVCFFKDLVCEHKWKTLNNVNLLVHSVIVIFDIAWLIVAALS